MSREENIFHADVKRAFSEAHGQRVIEELVAKHCRKVYNDNPFRMAYNAGQSDLVQHLVSLIEQELPNG